MFPLAFVPAAISAGQGIYNIIQGINQRRDADMINAKRPKKSVPGEIVANQMMAQDMANSQRMPGQSTAENNIKGGTANAINAIAQASGSTNNILAAVTGLNRNQNQAMNQLATQGAQFQFGNKEKLARANQVLANAKEDVFDYNQNQPYLMNLARKRALEQAGATNINNALTSLSNLGTSFVGSAFDNPKAYGYSDYPNYYY